MISAATLAKIEGRAERLYPHNRLRRTRYVAAQTALMGKGENEE